MKNLNALFEWYESKRTESEWSENILILSSCFREGRFANFTKIYYVKKFEDLILTYAFIDYENVIKCLSCIHHISIENAKLILINRLSGLISKLSIIELGDD